MIKKNQLGTSTLYVSEVGLGTMSFKTKTDAENMIHYAIDNGVNFIDTADLYQYGLNEEWVGSALKRLRHKVILATKVGNRWKPGQDGWTWDPSKTYIKKAVKESLRRLGTDYIDLYQLHGGTIDDPFEETISAFEDLQREGVIRYYGLSSQRPNVIKYLVKHANIVSVMMPYSLLDRRPEEELLSLLEAHNISVIARGTLAKGILTENYLAKIPTTGMLTYHDDEIIQLINSIQANHRRPITELAIRYPLSHPVVATVIPGASKLSQLKETLQHATSSPLTELEINLLQEVTKRNWYEEHR